jgi:tetraacyldisaccharide 4'-kinase
MPFKFHIDKRNIINYILLPLSAIFYILSSIRRALYRLGIFNTYTSPTPVIIVGNITAGGTGKTPVVIEIVRFLQSQGRTVGVVSRGYGRKNNQLVVVNQSTSTQDCGDEPLLIFYKTNATVVVAKDRVQAVQQLEHQVDIIVSDDGLQHLSMGRMLEIVVFNGFSNGFYLPAGGLREGRKRLDTVDIIINNTDKKIIPMHFINAETGEKYPLDYFTNEVIAICGIANPQRFFNTLKSLNMHFSTKIFKDHYNFRKNDFNYHIPIITTAKDWVKYKELDLDNMANIYYLDITIKLNNATFQQLENKLC